MCRSGSRRSGATPASPAPRSASPRGQTGAVGRVECVERVGRRPAHEREAPEAAEEPTLLVEPGCDVDRAVLRRRRLGQRPRDLDPVDHAHRAVEPASGRLGIGVGADEHRLAGIAGSSDDVAGPVDAGIEPRLLQPPAEPVPGFDIDRRERRPHHSDPAGPELPQSLQIGDQTFAIDGHFDCAHSRSSPIAVLPATNSSETSPRSDEECTGPRAMLAGAGASVYLRQTTKPSFARMNNRGPAAHCARDARVPGDASHGDTMATIRPGTAALAVTTDSKNRSETVATPVHDLRLLERAGWTNAEVIWEQIQESAAESERAGDYAEASELWLGGLELAREHFRPGDPRTAASVANVGVAKRRTGDSVAAEHMLDEALVRWDAGEQWIESLKPAAMARSSTFHLRLQSKASGRLRPVPARALPHAGDGGAGGPQRQAQRPPRRIRPARPLAPGASRRLRRLAQAAGGGAPDRIGFARRLALPCPHM